MTGVKRSASTTVEEEENEALKAQNKKLKMSLEKKEKEVHLLRAAIESWKGTSSFVLMELRLLEGIDKFIVKDKYITNLYGNYASWFKDIESRMSTVINRIKTHGSGGHTEENEKYLFYKTKYVDATQIRSHCFLRINEATIDFSNRFGFNQVQEKASYDNGGFDINRKSESWLCDRAIGKTIFLLHPTDHSKSIELQPDDMHIKGLSLSWQAEGIGYEHTSQKTENQTVYYSFLMCILRKYN